MASFVISAHGKRGAGTADGTYIIPPGVTVCFFQPDQFNLLTGGSDYIMKRLCTVLPQEALVQSLAVEIKTGTPALNVKIPNYYCEGDDDLGEFPTGVYRVGQPASAGPMIRIRDDGKKHYLGDVIGGQTRNGALGTVFYWLCCRAAPTMRNFNNYDSVVKNVLQQGAGGQVVNAAGARGSGIANVGVQRVACVEGLKPSDVIRKGGDWQPFR
jgi:hypothetical protein